MACASAVLLDGDRVLLVLRGKEPSKGLWSVPGGRVEPGETALEAARREIREETGLEAEIAGVCGIYEPVVRSPAGILLRPYRITVHFGRCSGEPRAGGDAADARFFALDECRHLDMTEHTLDWIVRAAQMLEEQASPAPLP